MERFLIIFLISVIKTKKLLFLAITLIPKANITQLLRSFIKLETKYIQARGATID